MFTLEVDESKNLVFIKLNGYIHNIKVGLIANKVKTALLSIPEGFSIVTDITELEPGSEESLVLLREIMELVETRKPSRVVRVEESGITKNQFNRAWHKAFVEYEVKRVKSVDEAFAYIDEQKMVG